MHDALDDDQRRLRGVVALCLVWLVAVAPVVPVLTAQGAPRVAFAGAVVDDGTIVIDGYLLGYDFAERDGHLYSDKAPGQQVLSLPFYAVGRAVGLDPASDHRADENLTVWWITLWTSVVPAAALTGLMGWSMVRRGTPVPLPALATMAFGTMILPLSSNLYGHVLSALCGFGAWVLVDRQRQPSFRTGLLVGACLAFGVTVEYTLGIVLVVVLGALVVRRHWATLAGAVATGVPFAVALGLYQQAAFGSPFSSGYADKPKLRDSTSFVTGIPDPMMLARSLFGTRGLFVFTPIVLVGIIGLVRRWRRSRDEGAMIALLVCAGFMLLQAGWQNPYGGDSPGPRYLTPMLPFVVLGLADLWADLPRLVRRLVATVSVLSMVLSTITYHLVGHGDLLIVRPLEILRDEGLTPTIWTIAFGPIGWVVYLATLGAVVWWSRDRLVGALDPSGGP